MMKSFCNFNLFRVAIVTCMSTCYSGIASAQEAFDCKKLLKQNIPSEKPQDILDIVKDHADCFGLDSVDLRVYGNGPALGTLLVARTNKSAKDLTYGDLLADINNVKRDTGYTAVRSLVIAQMTLEQKRFTPDNWDNSLKYLQVVGIPASDVEAFHKYALEKQEHHWTYRQLVVGYQMKKEAEAPVKQ